jgi:hypothetical protein
MTRIELYEIMETTREPLLGNHAVRDLPFIRFFSAPCSHLVQVRDHSDNRWRRIGVSNKS